jgi:Na+/H+-translocating membrane pyrophosphatase
MDEFSAFAGGVPFKTVDIATPEVLIGGLLGVMMVFYFVGLSVAAVGTTAGEVVNEVRRQFKEHPEIMEFKYKPNYKSCVALVRPRLSRVASPVACPCLFVGLGGLTERCGSGYSNLVRCL